MGIFKAHSWPGNIRQLHNVLRTALALADGLPISTLHLTQDFIDEISTPLLANINDSPLKSLDLGDVTSHAIQRAMQAESGNISAVARKLGISRNTLYRKLKMMGLS
jgi:transcriptional regulator of acetoin/glycerol metabolism